MRSVWPEIQQETCVNTRTESRKRETNREIDLNIRESMVYQVGERK